MKIITTMLAVVCAAILWDYMFVWWMGDGLEGLGGERRAVAEEFIEWAPKFCDAPAAALITRHWHVWVGQEPAFCSTMEKYDVQLTLYTLFGLPIGQLSQPACERLRCLSPLEAWE